MSGTAPLRRAGLVGPALVTVLVLVGVPLCIMVWVSLLGRGTTIGVDWQSVPSLANYARLIWEEDFDGTLLFNPTYLSILWRSVWQAAATTAICVLVGLPVALWMASLPRGLRNVVILLVTIPFWTNLLVRNYAWLIILREDGAVSWAVNALWPFGPVQLLYNDTAILIGLVYSFLPFMILPLYAVFEKFDWRLLEAAYDLGANRWRALRRVIIPLAMPGIIAGSMLVFIPSLGSFVTAALLGGGKSMMMGNLIQMQFGQSRNWPFGAAISVVLLALMMLVLMGIALWKKRAEQST
ncbi:ABC transporter permease [Aliigemmobacter aestuarii]|uniref:ABC transporter permease n=1 Tax=Aliigemmobacter aestuarii TaxID=1445661 RepID=A0A4V3V003_9RHOB|nr:ABC transporter permease [Gemmobacter aestuarii]THD80834.1 ABC transporter permease [Gemmobacter aestuarii]